MDTIDLVQLTKAGHRYDATITSETREDAQARRIEEAAVAAQKRHFAYVLFYFGLLAMGAVFVGCVYVFTTGAPEDKKWAAGLLSAIVSGLVGYLVGKGKN